MAGPYAAPPPPDRAHAACPGHGRAQLDRPGKHASSGRPSASGEPTRDARAEGRDPGYGGGPVVAPVGAHAAAHPQHRCGCALHRSGHRPLRATGLTTARRDEPGRLVRSRPLPGRARHCHRRRPPRHHDRARSLRLLSALSPGSGVNIVRKDGSTASFAVDALDNFPQDKFPDDLVYVDTPDAQLRLITCGGSYDHSKKRYTENTVVFAHLTTPATKKE
ncbi:sortase domain-containing protein [Streptomyces sp. NPDC003011]